MISDYLISYRFKCPFAAITAIYFWFFTYSPDPFIPANRLVTGFSGFMVIFGK